MHSSRFAFKIMSRVVVLNHMRDPRDCFLLGVCALEKTFHSRTRVLPRRRIIQRERSNNKAKERSKTAFARTRARTFARSSRSDARLHSPENSFRSFTRFSLGCSSLRDKIKSDIRLPQNIQRFHVLRLSQRERETEPFIRSVASPLSSCVLFLNKNTV